MLSIIIVNNNYNNNNYSLFSIQNHLKNLKLKHFVDYLSYTHIHTQKKK